MQVLLAIERGRRADRVFETEALAPEIRPWVHQVVYGVQRMRGRLDHLLGVVSSRPLAELDAPVRAILRAGLYEVLSLGTPTYAGISQGVELARDVVGEGAARLTNAVLRRAEALSHDPDAFPAFEADPLGHLSSWGSHPRWLVERWLRQWTPGDVRALVESNNRQPPVFLVPADGDPHRLRSALETEGVVGAALEEGVGSVRLPAGTRLRTLLPRVHAFVQDPGASLVVGMIDPGDGAFVADLCAAPGGKALGLAARGLRVVAADASESRLHLLAASVRRLGLGVTLMVADAGRPPLRKAPVVLLDAPCTGTGTLRRHPDGRWRLRPKDIRAMAGVQERLLDGAAPLVPPGGLLVYATCSLEPEENQEQVERFLSRRPDFRLEAPRTMDPRFLDERGRLTVLPQQSGYDGAFAARLRRDS